MGFRISDTQMHELSAFRETARMAGVVGVHVDLKNQELKYLLELIDQQHEALMMAQDWLSGTINSRRDLGYLTEKIQVAMDWWEGDDG